jgi:uncharacterized Fe-S center protein
MPKAKVYFTSMRAAGFEPIPDKMIRLARAAGIDQMDFEGKFTAIKLHFGEDGNLAFLRPDYARALVQYIKGRGGKPFVTDASTLYVGARKNALDHLDVAYQHGYNPFQLGCHTIIADGLKGDDEAIIDVDGAYVKHAKIGRAVADCDVFISLTHFKGHEGTGFGGALKNIGMGCGSSAGKAEMHESEKPTADPETCIGCNVCVENCAHDAVHLIAEKAHVDFGKCVGCGRCIGVCPTKAMAPSAENGCELLSRRVSEYAYAVLKDRPHFHISLVIDISPFCDCYGNNDAPIVPDVGMFASFDPVALDKACVDAVNAQPIVDNSLLGMRKFQKRRDHLYTLHPDTKWEAGIEQGVHIGLGTDDYELVTIE